MAYSDYGGYAFRNGQRVEDRSDAVLSPEGIKSTPGQWPGWTLEEGRSGGSYHALLGDGPIFVSLYKQSSVGLHRLGERLDLLAVENNVPADRVSEYDGRRYLSAPHDASIEDDEPSIFKVDGHTLEVFWLNEDNYYVYARLIQPDGTVWTGWSGYGVGAGLEDAEYGYSTEDRNDTLAELFGLRPLP